MAKRQNDKAGKRKEENARRAGAGEGVLSFRDATATLATKPEARTKGEATPLWGTTLPAWNRTRAA